ncbi:MAG: hypothetical protein LBI18_05870, partial [Planctomycetaceae bacterium]|nr:hypothetical protein [Planctomycetaceae bacterium]
EFTLKKQDINNWIIEHIQRHPKDLFQRSFSFPILFENDSRSIEKLIGRNFTRGLMISIADWLPVIFNQPEFHIIDAKKIKENNENLIWIKYDYKPKQRQNQLVRSGEIYLLPEHYWLIKRAEVVVSESNGRFVNSSISCQYDFVSGNIPRLVSHKLFIKEYNQTLLRIFSNYEIVEKINTQEFTLSHYGFPEPDFDNSRRTNHVRYILMGLGIIMILFAIWRMIQKRRERK